MLGNSRGNYLRGEVVHTSLDGFSPLPDKPRIGMVGWWVVGTFQIKTMSRKARVEGA